LRKYRFSVETSFVDLCNTSRSDWLFVEELEDIVNLFSERFFKLVVVFFGVVGRSLISELFKCSCYFYAEDVTSMTGPLAQFDPKRACLLNMNYVVQTEFNV
jgi:hypothetical protein